MRYARSTNAGASFGSSVRLSPLDQIAVQVDVARGPNGRVVVSWTRGVPYSEDSSVRVRVSTDGGASFGPTRVIASNGAIAGRVALGDGVIYVAYSTVNFKARVRRSVDGGNTWNDAFKVSTARGDGPTITASGSTAYVGFQRCSSTTCATSVRTTTNSGSSWSVPVNLTSSTGKPAEVPELTVSGAIVRAAYARCRTFTECAETDVYYRESSNGTTWTSQEKVSTSSTDLALPQGIAVSGRILVMYSASTFTNERQGELYVRRGTP